MHRTWPGYESSQSMCLYAQMSLFRNRQGHEEQLLVMSKTCWQTPQGAQT